MKLRSAVALWLGLWTGYGIAGEEAAKEAAPAKAPVVAKPKTLKEKASYSIGINIGRNFKSQAVEVDLKILLKGIQDGLAGGKTLMTAKEMQETMRVFQTAMREKQSKKAKVQGGKNVMEGEKFLAENKNKPGVETLPSGLQYKVITAGTGEKPKATDTVEAHYRGTLVDGTEFDSSYKRGEPLTIPVNRVIAGWTEALQLMPVGSKWQLFIPSNLAYGERGAGPVIGPNATLIFEIELLSIK